MSMKALLTILTALFLLYLLVLAILTVTVRFNRIPHINAAIIGTLLLAGLWVFVPLKEADESDKPAEGEGNTHTLVIIRESPENGEEAPCEEKTDTIIITGRNLSIERR